jgi:sugar phosphate isomerase/epimerase
MEMIAVLLSLYTLLAKEEPLEDAIKLAADAGFDAVDIRQAEDGKHLPNGAPTSEGERVKQLVADHGLHISGLTTYYRIGHTDAGERDAEMAGIENSMDLAVAMGAKYFRISGPIWDAAIGYELQRKMTRDQAVTITEMAAERDVAVTVEQHGGALTASAGQIVDLFRDVTGPNFGIVYDPGNCLREGYERPLVQVDMLQPMIKAVHVKNAMSKTDEPPQEMIPVDQIRLDKGILDWPAIITAIVTGGYEGYFTLEDFSTFDSLAEKFSWAVDYLRAIESDLPDMPDEPADTGAW